MSTSFRAKYLEVLSTFDDWIIVSEWAQRFTEKYPDLLDKANREAENQANDTTGIREIAARIGSIISQGGYEDKIEIDTSERPRKVRYIAEKDRVEHEKQDIEDDVAPLRRSEIIKLALQSMGNSEQYRITELESISKQLKTFFELEFEVDHASALLNRENPGGHQPDNLQILLKAHNAKKNNDNWVRFSIDEQIDYIEGAIRIQGVVASRMGIEMEYEILESILERLRKVF